MKQNTETPQEVGIRRNGRALIGWMPEQEGLFWLAGRQVIQGAPQPDDQARVRGAIRAVAARSPGVDQSAVVSDLPQELGAHVVALQGNPQSVTFFNEGFRVALVNLKKVCALQPHVCTDNIQDRFASADLSSLGGIADLTIPIPSPNGFPVQFDPTKNAFLVSSPNPNLRIVGNFQAPLDGGIPGLGFALAVSPSYLQVAQYRGRYVLRDGYHRAVGLLSRGVEWVPAFVKDFATFEEMTLPSGLLPQDCWLGDRPPMLADYQQNDVACAVKVPTTQKLIVIQALEVHTLA